MTRPRGADQENYSSKHRRVESGLRSDQDVARNLPKKKNAGCSLLLRISTKPQENTQYGMYVPRADLLVPEYGNRELLELPVPDGHVVDLPHRLEAVKRVRDGGARRYVAVPTRGKKGRVVRFGEHPPVVPVTIRACARKRAGQNKWKEGGEG